jgi:hypothetical protein
LTPAASRPDLALVSPTPLRPEDVDALIPALERVFARVSALETELIARANELERLGHGAGTGPSGEAPPEIEDRRGAARENAAAIRATLAEIDQLGGQLYDAELGIVEFPGTLEGRPVWLHWQRGEPRLVYYREPDAALAARRPLPGRGPGSSAKTR